MLHLASLFFFTMASVGFLLFMLRYPRTSEVRIWGIRLSHFLGYLGVAMMRLDHQHFSEVSVMIVSSLTLSLVAYEVTLRLLR